MKVVFHPNFCIYENKKLALTALLLFVGWLRQIMERFELEARLSFKELPDGSIGLVPHAIRKEPKLGWMLYISSSPR